MVGLLDRLEARLAGLLGWGARAGWRGYALVLLIALALTLPGFGALPVTDRDEARFAQASKQMLETGDWIDIRFQDRPRWKKPAGIYWMQAGAAALAGGAEAPIWAYRLPSVLGALGGALALAWAARALLGGRGALLAGLMLPAVILVAAEATIAKTDAMLMATAILVFGALARAMPAAAPSPRPSPPRGEGAPVDRSSVPTGATGGWGIALIFWTALAAAILLKGPIVPVIAALALIWLGIARRQLPPIAHLRPLAGLTLTAVLVAPWLIAIWIVSEGAFFAESVGRDLLGKVTEGQEKHWGPPGLYALLVWGTFWPWAALIPMAAPWAWARRRADWLSLIAGWVIPFWLILEAVPTKLPHYVLPLYPALLVVLAAWVLADDRTRPGPRLRWAGALLVAIPGVGLAFALLALPVALEGRLPWPAVALALIGGAAALLAARAALADLPLAQVGASLIAALALYPGILELGLPSLSTLFPSPQIVALTDPWMPCAEGPLASAGYREPSLVFHAGTDTRLPSPPETARILETEPSALVLVEDRWWPLIEPHFTAAKPPLIARGALSYFNYNRGDFERARLWTRDAPRWAPCAG